jgi:hypothetical protein
LTIDLKTSICPSFLLNIFLPNIFLPKHFFAPHRLTPHLLAQPPFLPSPEARQAEYSKHRKLPLLGGVHFAGIFAMRLVKNSGDCV